jgi:hypothetical protein
MESQIRSGELLLKKERLTSGPQILSIACDNASCNNVMIEQLAKSLTDFSEVNRTRCFLHIVNLCAKSIIRQFDVQKRGPDEPVDATERELQDLAEDIDLEEQQAAELLKQHAVGDNENEDDADGWIDEMAVLSLAERAELHEDIWPVKLVLVKVCHKQINTHILTMLGSSERLRSKLSTQQRSSFPRGDSNSRN